MHERTSATTENTGRSGQGKQTRPMTLTQKILAQHAIGLTRPWVETGDMLQIRVDWTIASELAWNGMDRTYTLLGRPADRTTPTASTSRSTTPSIPSRWPATRARRSSPTSRATSPRRAASSTSTTPT